MHNRQRAWIWSSAAVSFVVGLILVLNDSSAGWMLIIIGISYLGLLTRGGQAWAASNPSIARWGLIVVTLLVILLVILLGVVLLLK